MLSTNLNYLSASSSGEGNEVIEASMQAYSDHMAAIENAMHTFSNSIAEKGWQLKAETPADGNCCFHAVSSQHQTLQPSRIISPGDLNITRKSYCHNFQRHI